jgi:NADH dehydrogenase/NADH:ubiquinone oxidoreductase subunit G
MSDEVTLKINDQSITVLGGTTLLEAARAAGVDIPTICVHEACTPNAVCRMCVVEVQGARVLVPSCATLAGQGMVVQTDSERVRRIRRTILEMLAASLDLSEAPEIQAQMLEYHAEGNRFPEAQIRQPEPIQDNPMYVRDYAKCVLCWRCVQVCAEDTQYTYAINFSGRGFSSQVSTFYDKALPETTCVFCGQCVGVCPTGALKPTRAWLLEQGKSADEILEMTRSRRRARRRLEADR